MKKNYILLTSWALLCANFIQAQFTCPETLGPQSTTTTIHFKVTGGSCGVYPMSINIVDGAYNQQFNRTSCNGTNLKYTTTGQVLPRVDTFSAFFPIVGLCRYENGVLVPLSNNDASLNAAVSIYPNPLIKEKQLTLKFAYNLSAEVFMFDVNGKLAMTDEVNNVKTKRVNTSALTNGIYFLRIATDEASITRKVIIMN